MAYNAIGTSAPSEIAAAETPAVPVPVAPTGLSATPNSATQVTLTWSDNSDNETDFQIYRCLGSGCSTFSYYAAEPPNTTAYTVAGLSEGATYGFRVRARNGSLESGWSNIVHVSTLSRPVAPSGLAAVVVSASRVDLSWSDQSDNENEFVVERCTGASCTNFSSVATPNANATTYSNTGLSAATAYRYRLKAVNSIGESGPSNIVLATTPAVAPSAPTGITASTVSDSRIDIRWNDASTNETSFTVERCAGATCTNFALRSTLPAGFTSYDDGSLAPLTTYRYRVSAVNSAGSSPGSIVSATTLSVHASCSLRGTVGSLTTYTDGSSMSSSDCLIGGFHRKLYGGTRDGDPSARAGRGVRDKPCVRGDASCLGVSHGVGGRGAVD